MILSSAAADLTLQLLHPSELHRRKKKSICTYFIFKSRYSQTRSVCVTLYCIYFYPRVNTILRLYLKTQIRREILSCLKGPLLSYNTITVCVQTQLPSATLLLEGRLDMSGFQTLPFLLFFCFCFVCLFVFKWPPHIASHCVMARHVAGRRSRHLVSCFLQSKSPIRVNKQSSEAYSSVNQRECCCFFYLPFVKK